MSQVFITITLPDGREVQMALAQAMTLARLNRENPGSSWHFNECGCCICLHPYGEKSLGWIVGQDGSADLYHHELQSEGEG